MDLAHQPAFAYIPYLITGDWYFLEELYFAAAHDLGGAVNGTTVYSRHNSWGWFNDLDVQTRGQAWGRRDIAEAAFMAPDNSSEKAYFTEKVNNNLAIEEGYQNTTAGSFYQACTTDYDEGLEGSKWCWGRKTAAQNWDNPLHYGSVGGSYDELILDSDLVPQNDPHAPTQADRPWQMLYKLNVAGHVHELGFAAAGANGAAFKHLINILSNPSFNPYLCGAYTVATVSKAGVFYQDWTTLLNSFNSSFQSSGGVVNLRTVDRWWDNSSDDNSPDGYPHICQAAASYLVGLSDGPYSGESAWQWTVSHIGRDALNTNPQYSILPRLAGCAAGYP